MKQHPVPQNITSYQFRLVGDMTLKQFLELAGGLLLAYITYVSNLIFFIKWPLVLLFAFLGLAMAFFPIEERPLDQWIINFIKSIYSPTRFTWKKTGEPPSIFISPPKRGAPQGEETKERAKKTPQPITPQEAEAVVADEEEDSRISQIESLFEKVVTPLPKEGTIPKHYAKPQVTVRKLGAEDTAQAPPKKQTAPQAEVQRTQDTTPEPTKVAPKEETVIFEKPTVSKQKIGNAGEATVDDTKNLPPTPTDPSIVVGTVMDKEGKLVENAIVEITDEEGASQRAVRTNALGQFFTATPLSNGSYVAMVEKEGLEIPPQKLEVGGGIISPLSLRPS